MRQSTPPRRGVTAIAVLVCLLVVTVIAGVLMRIALSGRDRIRAEERRLQAEWLVESGLERAAARLASEPPAYRGETWELPPDSLGATFAGRVSIEVEPMPDEPSLRRVRVQGDYPSDAPRRHRVSKVAIVRAAASPGDTP